MGVVARDRHDLGVGRVVAQGIDHDLLLRADAELGDEPGEPGFEHETQVQQEEGRPAAPQIGAQRRALSRQEGPRIGRDEEGAPGRHVGLGGEDELPRLIPLRFERAAQPPHAVARHLHHLRAGVVVAVAGAAFQVRVVFEVVHRQLAVALEEAGRNRAPAQCALDTDGNLCLVRALHQHPASLRLDDRGVVQLDPLLARESRVPVGIDRDDFEQRVAPGHDREEVARAPPRGVLGAIKVGDGYLAGDLVDRPHGPPRWSIDLLAR